MSGGLLLVGCGKMGAALLAGWIERGIGAPYTIVEPHAAAAGAFTKRLDVAHVAHARDLPAGLAPDAVVIAVKPQVTDEVLPPYARFTRALFLSIAAGRTIGYFERMFGEPAAIVRGMPNTPAQIARGITVMCANAHVNAAQRHLADRLMAAVGEVGWVADENLIDAVTGVSGSGPAYAFLLVECMAAAGMAQGLPAPLAMQLARATVSGAGELMHRTDTEASKLREAVTSPNGTTAAALKVLMAEDGLKPLMERAIAAATRRSKELAG
jgi:pyrroline-5-carboxylate reductase